MLSQMLRRAALPGSYRGLSTGLMFRFSDDQQNNDNSEGKNNEITKENAKLIIDKWVKNNKVVLFMKGTPHQPRCGYSNFVVELLKKYGKHY